jgi:hypothetical protein
VTDTLTPRDPWPILRAVLETTRPDEFFSARHWHYEADVAQLTSRAIGAAMKTAWKAGYLERVGEWITINGVREFSPNVIEAGHTEAKGRTVHLYRRTDKTFRSPLYDLAGVGTSEDDAAVIEPLLFEVP